MKKYLRWSLRTRYRTFIVKKYLRWLLRVFYLIFFQPTQYTREVEGLHLPLLTPTQRVRKLVKLMPGIIVLTLLGDYIVSLACEAYEIPFSWFGAWHGVTFGLMASLGAAYGTLAHGVAVGVGVGVIVGVLGGVAPTVVAYGEFGLAFTVALCAGHGAGYGVADQLPDGVGSKVRIGPIYILFGIALGALADGLMGAVLSGVAFAAAYAVMYSRLITYLFDVVLAAVTGCIGWLWPGGARRAWRWCPVVWDEIIWLPLPFAGGLLTRLVRQDREEGFRQISFVAAQRPLQRRAARAALVEVALDDLRADSLMRMSNIAERLGWTTDAPVNLPSELEAALPRFDRTAQHVGQYFTLSSPYRRGEALGRAVAEAESLRRSLVAARGPYALRLLQTANEWRRLLDRENEWVKALPAAVREIPNPFIFGPPVGDSEDNVFTGRRDVVRQIEASLLGAAQAPTLLLQGPRRMGKTSILNQLPRLLGPDFAPAIVDCQNPAVTGSEATLLRYLSRALSEGLRRRRVAVEELKAQQLAREPYAVFDEWLEKVEKAMPKGMRALLCLDEYERLQAALAAGWGAPFLDSLRHTFQHRPRVVLMFTGAHTFQELGPAWTDRFISARRMRVSFLNREDVELLLTKPIPEFDMTYAAGALDALVAATNCHPFLTQAVAFELVQLMNEAQRREASAADVEEAVGRALVSGDAYFVNVWGDAGKEGQAVLRALAAGETPPDFPAARAWLREHDVIGTDGDFAVEMMRRWVASRDLKFQI